MSGIAESCRENSGRWTHMIRLVMAAVTLSAAVLGLTPKAAAQPANDFFTNAIVLLPVQQGSLTNDNIRASRETNEPIHSATSPQSARSVWFKWTPTDTGPVVFDTFGSDFDTILAVYQLNGTNGLASLVRVASNDDAAPDGTSRVQFNVTQLTNYYVVVDGFGAGVTTAEGTYVLNWNQGNPTNPPVLQDVIQFSSATYTVNENARAATITVWYGGPSDPTVFDPITVDYFTSNGTAIDGTNYLGTTNTLTFNPLDPTTWIQTFNVTNINDAFPNNSRFYYVDLANVIDPNGYATIGDPAEATVTIIDDDAPRVGTTAGAFSFSSRLYVGTEYESGDSPYGGLSANSRRSAFGVIVTVNRSLPADGRVLVDFATEWAGNAAGRTPAKPNLEFPLTTGTLEFDDYQMSASFVIPVHSDNVPNVSKYFNVVLSNPRPDPSEVIAAADQDVIVPYLSASGARTSVEIIDLANATNGFSIERTTYRADEYGSINNTNQDNQITVDVILPRGGPGTVGLRVVRKVDRYSVPLMAGSDYAEGSDYTDTSRNWPTTLFTDGTVGRTNPVDFTFEDVTLTFPQNGPGAFRQSHTFTIKSDDVVEFNEDFVVELHDPDNAHGIGPNSAANLTILFDDQPAGAADREWNPEYVAGTQPPYNTTPGANNTVQAVAVQSWDNRTLLVGDFTAVNAVSRNRVARMNPNGSVDVSFNPGSGANGTVSAVAIYGTNYPNTGQILIGGEFTSFNGASRRGLARLNPNGTLDLSFNVGTGADGPVHSITLQSDGKVLVAGDFAHFNDVEVNGIMRLNIDGSVDSGFNPGSGADGNVWAVAVRDTAQTIFNPRSAAGTEFEDVNVIETGANQGTITINYDFLSIPDNIRVFYDGQKIFDVTTSGVGQFVIPYGPGTGTEVTIIMNQGTGISGTAWFYTAFVTPIIAERTIYVAGEFSAFNGQKRTGIARLKDNGSLDAGFDPGVGPNGPVYALAVQADGRVLIGGEFEEYQNRPRNNIARIRNNGALDVDYHVGTGANDPIYTLTLQPDGKAFVGGVFTSYNGARRVGIMRLHTSGALDTSFMDTAYNQFAGVIRTYHYEAPRAINSIALQPDGNVMIGGSFSRVGGNFSIFHPLIDYALSFDWYPLYNNNTYSFFGYIFGSIYENPFTRADKVTRYNVARLIGGYTPGPGNLEFDPNAQPFAIDENAGFFSATVRRVDGNLGTIAMNGSIVGNTAIAGQDFDVNAFTPIWPEYDFVGPRSIGFPGLNYLDIPIIDDTFREGDETFDVFATGLAGQITLGGEVIPLGTAAGFNDAARVTIADNDFDHGVFNFALANFVTNENAVAATITVIRTNGSSGAVTVDYLVQNGTALAGSDYVGIAGPQRLSFAAGQTSRTFTVQLLNDALVEPDETVNLILTNATGGATLPGGTPVSTATATLTIIDDDFAPGHLNLTAANYVTNETAGFVSVMVTRTGGSIAALAVNYETSDGTAVQPDDYTRTTNRLTWNSGDTTARTILIPIRADGLVEGDETFNIRLFNPSIAGALGPSSNAVITITDGDSYGSFSFSQPAYFVGENAGSAIISVLRRGGVAGTVSVTATALPGTAIKGEDFDATNVVLTFLPGEVRKTFHFAVLDDSASDGDKTVTLVLTDPVNATVGAVSNALLTIVDNEGINSPAGSLDTTFSTDAQVDGAIYSVLLQTNGSMIIGGEFTKVKATPRNRLARLLPDGHLDNTFDVGPGADGAIRAAALQKDGRLLVGGAFHTINSTNRNGIARLSTDGKVDIAFDPGSGADNPVFALLVLPDDRVIAGGSFSHFNGRSTPGIVGLETNGVLNPRFNVGAGFNGSVFALGLQDDGKIIVGGDFKTFNGVARTNVARLNPDGTLDTTFNPVLWADAPVRAILVESDGRIIIGGSFTNVNGTQRRYLARLESDGTLDTTFLAGPNAGADATVFAIAQQIDSLILVGGEFGRFNGVTRNGITRLRDVDGSTDPGINFGDGANGAVAAIALQLDGKIIIGGGFTKYDGQPRQGLARIYGGSIAGGGAIEFATPEVQVTESDGTALLTLARRGGTAGDATVRFDTYDGTAIAGVDYQTGSGIITFPEGETRKTIAVAILPNNRLDGDRSLYVLLSEFNGADPGLQPYATIDILDDESILSFTSTEYSVNENAISGQATIGVTRTGGTNTTVSVRFSTVDGTATDGLDYRGTNGTLVFLPGQTFKNFNVPVIDDTVSEANETVLLQMSNPSASAVMGQSNAVLVIVDNDFGVGAFAFSQTNYVVDEAAGNVDITILRTNGSSGVASVRLRASDGTALAGFDYTPTDRILTFADGETVKTVSIAIQNDSLLEGNEFALLSLSQPTGGALLDIITNAVLTILDDEAGVRFQTASYAVAEDDGAVRITVLRSGNTNVAASVDFSTVSGTAVESLDFTPTNGTLVFNPGVVSLTFDVRIIPDNLTETNETFTVVLQNQSANVQLGTPSVATVNVADSARFVAFDYDNFTVNEGDTNAVITLHRYGLLTRGISVILRTRDGTAIAGADYVAFSNIVKFAAGEVNKTVLIPIIDDGLTEAQETLHLELLFPTNAAVGVPGVADLNIVDNDPGPGFADSTFNVGLGANKFVNSVAVQPDGRILIGGAFTNFAGVTNRNYLVRVLTNGAFDASFDPGTGPNALVSALTVSPDNRIIVGGTFTSFNGSTAAARLARLTLNGPVDPLFTAASRFDAAVNSVDTLPDNRILAGGGFSMPNRGVARIRINGTSDLTFDPSSGADGVVYAVSVQPDGTAYAGGAFTNFGGFAYPRLVRLGASGLVDVSMTPVSITNGAIYSIARAADNRIVIGGSFRYIGGVPRRGVARLNWDGTIDPTFDPGTGVNGTVYTVQVLADGRVFIGGDFMTVNDIGRNRYALFAANGSVDDSFDSSVGADGTVYSSAVQPDQKVIIGGDFRTVGGEVNRGVARINVGEAVPLRLGVPRLAGGSAIFTAATISGLRYALDASVDMVNWSSLSTNTATGTTLVFTDPNAPSYSKRFYRVRRVDP